MADTKRLEALEEALRAKSIEMDGLRLNVPNILERDKKRERLREEMTEIKEEMEKLAFMMQIEEFTNQARGYIALAKDLVDANKEEAAEVIRILLKLVIDLRNSLEPQLAELSAIGAKATYRDFKNLIDAGFSKVDAFRIVLAKIKPVGFMETMSSVASKAMETKRS